MKFNFETIKNILIIFLIIFLTFFIYNFFNGLGDSKNYKNRIKELNNKLNNLNVNYDKLEKEKTDLLKQINKLQNKIKSMDRESYIEYLKENYG